MSLDTERGNYDNSGVIVGLSDPDEENDKTLPMQWASPSSTPTYLCTPIGDQVLDWGGANSISDSGVVVGAIRDSDGIPFSYAGLAAQFSGGSYSFLTASVPGYSGSVVPGATSAYQVVDAIPSGTFHWIGDYGIPVPSAGGAFYDGLALPNETLNCINGRGVAVGNNPSGSARAVLRNSTGETIIPGGGHPFFINNAMSGTTPAPQIVGYGSSGNPTLWELSHLDGTPSTTYVPKNLAELIPTNSGWSFSPVGSLAAINDVGAIVGTATASGSNPAFVAGTHSVMLFNGEVGVDANRDGTIVLANDAGNSANAGLPVDSTSQAKPFRFWVNSFDERNSQDNIDSSYQDSSSTTIVDQRDLENFTRLWIYNKVPSGFFGSTKVQFGLKWKSVTGTPSIRLFTAVESDGGTQYLSSTGYGSSQIGPDGNALTDKNGLKVVAPVSGAGADFIFADGNDNNYSPTSTERYYIFEGTGVGQGELMPVYLDSTGKEIGEGPGVWLDLENLKTMYKSSDADQFVQAWDETQQAIVFVHGWNMTADGSRTYAEDLFKRLWQRGYKGRFCYFRWNTEYGPWSNDFNPSDWETDLNSYLADYNGSEYIAWHSGAALNTFIGAAVPSGYSKNLVAHSMGNIVSGSALLNGLGIAHYALLNAAVPSCCYDTSTAREQTPPSSRTYPVLGNVTLWGNPTPDDDPDSATRALAYRGRLSSYSGKNLFSFYLPNDDATVYAWELNNAKFKPGNSASLVYDYDRGEPAGQKLFSISITLSNTFLTDPLEAMPYADQSWSKAAGADGGTGGAITGSRDMNASYGFGSTHSAEFNFDIQAVGAFYYDLLNTFGIQQTFLDSSHPSTE